MREFPPFRLDTVNQCLWRGEGTDEERICRRIVPVRAEGSGASVLVGSASRYSESYG